MDDVELAEDAGGLSPPEEPPCAAPAEAEAGDGTEAVIDAAEASSEPALDTGDEPIESKPAHCDTPGDAMLPAEIESSPQEAEALQSDAASSHADVVNHTGTLVDADEQQAEAAARADEVEVPQKAQAHAPVLAAPAAPATPATQAGPAAAKSPAPEPRPSPKVEDVNGPIAAAPPSNLPPKPSTAPASYGAERPLRGTLALENRGFKGVFKTPGGKLMTPADMVAACDRLTTPEGAMSAADMAAFFAALPPRPKTSIGKDRITPDELSELVGRLCSPRQDYAAAAKVPRKPVKLKWSIDEKGLLKYDLVQLPAKPDSQRTEYLKELYSRCIEGHAKTKAMLSEKYLKPLYTAKVYEGASGKEKIKAIADKLYKGESTKD